MTSWKNLDEQLFKKQFMQLAPGFYYIPPQKTTWTSLRWLAGLPKMAKLIFFVSFRDLWSLNQLANQLKPH